MQPVTGRGRIFFAARDIKLGTGTSSCRFMYCMFFFFPFPYFLAESRPIVMTGNQLDPVEERTHSWCLLHPQAIGWVEANPR